jgi:Ricin-type beta-trefoil lectin domain
MRNRSMRRLLLVVSAVIVMIGGLGGAPAAARPAPSQEGVSAGSFDWSFKNANSEMCLGIRGGAHHHGAPAIQWDCDRDIQDQRWGLVHVIGDYYWIVNRNTPNRCLGIAGGDMRHGAPAIQWECTGAPDQYWDLDLDIPRTHIRNVNSGMCLGIRGGARHHGAPAIQWDCDWRIFDQSWDISPRG